MRRLIAVAAGACLLGAAVPVAHAAVMCFGRAATVIGSARNDVLRGTAGDDVIAALAGRDIVYAGGGNDFVCGGKGRDAVYGDHTSATAVAASQGDDALSGGSGGDRLIGDDNADVDGNTLIGNSGDDYIDAGAPAGATQRNIVAYNDAPGPIHVSITAGGTGRAVGVDGVDTLVHLGVVSGSRFNDHFGLATGAGVDRLAGAGGADTFYIDGFVFQGVNGDGGCFDIYCLRPPGTPGPDTFTLGPNAEFDEAGIRGNERADTLNGSAASDFLRFDGPDPGSDRINGFGGKDTIDVTDGVSGNDTADGGAGADSCRADAGDRLVSCEG